MKDPERVPCPSGCRHTARGPYVAFALEAWIADNLHLSQARMEISARMFQASSDRQ